MTEEMPTAGMLTRLMTLGQAARLAATGRGGKPPHVATVARWITKGVCLRDGTQLRLKALRTPGGWRVAERWVAEFFDALTRDRLGPDAPGDRDGAAAAAART